jgi:hypothetical protein
LKLKGLGKNADARQRLGVCGQLVSMPAHAATSKQYRRRKSRLSSQLMESALGDTKQPG